MALHNRRNPITSVFVKTDYAVGLSNGERNGVGLLGVSKYAFVLLSVKLIGSICITRKYYWRRWSLHHRKSTRGRVQQSQTRTAIKVLHSPSYISRAAWNADASSCPVRKYLSNAVGCCSLNDDRGFMQLWISKVKKRRINIDFIIKQTQVGLCIVRSNSSSYSKVTATLSMVLKSTLANPTDTASEGEYNYTWRGFSEKEHKYIASTV